MSKLRVLAALGLTVALAACSSAPTIDAQAWEPAGNDYSPTACGDLLPEWGMGGQEAPVACWTYDETDGLPDRFTELVASMTEHAGTEPVRGPGCMSTMTCIAEWEGAQGFVTLSSGVSLVGLQASVDAGESADPGAARLYELVLWADEEQVLTDTEWDQFYEPLTP